VAGSTDGRGISRGTRRPPIWCATMIVPTGRAFQRRIRAMGIRDRPISPKSPWQNPYAERLIGTLRRECLDHVLIVGEQYLRRILASYWQCTQLKVMKPGESSQVRSTLVVGRAVASAIARVWLMSSSPPRAAV
jgi:transposase InsO family protein